MLAETSLDAGVRRDGQPVAHVRSAAGRPVRPRVRDVPNNFLPSQRPPPRRHDVASRPSPLQRSPPGLSRSHTRSLALSGLECCLWCGRSVGASWSPPSSSFALSRGASPLPSICNRQYITPAFAPHRPECARRRGHRNVPADIKHVWTTTHSAGLSEGSAPRNSRKTAHRQT